MTKVNLDEIRKAAENDLITFIKVVSPGQVLGACHEELLQWWTREDHKSHQLVLFPRDHQKSRMVAYRVAWELTKDPTLRILYISATANLAEKQLGFIKGILTSRIYQQLWPQHIQREEGKRTKWTNSEIALDHPLRKRENIRDPSIFTGGLTTGLTGLHCDIAVLDDVVVFENAYTEEGRTKVRDQYSLLSSIEGADAKEWIVGTRYHAKDLYNDLLQMVEVLYDEEGEPIGESPIYEILERQVEDHGEFLWPRQQRKDGKWFGFNQAILAKKKGQYLNQGQFRAQYYNDPTDPDNVPVPSNKFQYYDRKHIVQREGHWYFREKKLNVFAAMDFAYSLGKRSDYTAIVVVGMDHEGFYYVLDIERFKTDRISEYFAKLVPLIEKWNFRKLRAEVTVAQAAIVNQLKDLLRGQGLAVAIDEYRPTKGSKEERIASSLEPRYDAMSIFHYKGGNCQILEEELQSRNPPHDDVKDALAACIDICVKPSQRVSSNRSSSIDWSSQKFRGR